MRNLLLSSLIVFTAFISACNSSSDKKTDAVTNLDTKSLQQLVGSWSSLTSKSISGSQDIIDDSEIGYNFWKITNDGLVYIETNNIDDVSVLNKKFEILKIGTLVRNEQSLITISYSQEFINKLKANGSSNEQIDSVTSNPPLVFIQPDSIIIKQNQYDTYGSQFYRINENQKNNIIQTAEFHLQAVQNLVRSVMPRLINHSYALTSYRMMVFNSNGAVQYDNTQQASQIPDETNYPDGQKFPFIKFINFTGLETAFVNSLYNVKLRFSTTRDHKYLHIKFIRQIDTNSYQVLQVNGALLFQNNGNLVLQDHINDTNTYTNTTLNSYSYKFIQ